MPRGLGRFELNRFNGRSCCIQHGHPGLVGMDSVSKDGVQGAALWTNPHVQATGGASRPLLSRPIGLRPGAEPAHTQST